MHYPGKWSIVQRVPYLKPSVVLCRCFIRRSRQGNRLPQTWRNNSSRQCQHTGAGTWRTCPALCTLVHPIMGPYPMALSW